MYHLRLWDLLTPHMISQSSTELHLKKKVFILLGRGKHPLGPSLTASCLSAVQDGLHTHQPSRRESRRKPACPMWCSKCSILPRVVGVNPTLNSPLFSEFVFPLGAMLKGNTCCRNTESEARPWPSWIQSDIRYWPNSWWMVMQKEKWRLVGKQSVTQSAV